MLGKLKPILVKEECDVVLSGKYAGHLAVFILIKIMATQKRADRDTGQVVVTRAPLCLDMNIPHEAISDSHDISSLVAARIWRDLNDTDYLEKIGADMLQVKAVKHFIFENFEVV